MSIDTTSICIETIYNLWKEQEQKEKIKLLVKSDSPGTEVIIL